MTRSRRLPILLRLVALGARFFLIFALARLLLPDQVGIYGLVTAVSGYVVLALGFDFYTYSTRQILRSPRLSWRTYLRSQLTFMSLLYVVGYPAIALLFVFGLLPWSVFLWFILLVPLEHAGLELDRILIAMSDQLSASVGLFLRQAMMPLSIVPAMIIFPSWRSIDIVLVSWIVFDLLGVLAGLFFLRRLIRDQEPGRVDWVWIRRGVKVAIPFIIGTLCLRALFTADRQLIAIFADLEVLGAYALFMTIAAGMTQVIGTGVHQFLYPQLVSAAHAKDGAEFFKNFRALAFQTALISAAISGGVLLALPQILVFLDHEIYAQYSGILPWALLITAIYNLSLVPHFGLYALDADRAILTSTIASFALFVVVATLFVQHAPVVAVLTAVGAASVTLLFAKSVALALCLRHRRFS